MVKNIGWEDYTIATCSEKSFPKQNHKKPYTPGLIESYDHMSSNKS